MKNILIISLIISFSYLSNARDNIAINNKPKIPLTIGVQGGYHSSNLKEFSSDFNGNVSFGLYLKFDFSNDVHVTVGYSYWKANTDVITGSNLYIPSETINSNGGKLDVDFPLLKTQKLFLLMGPSFLIEKVSTSHSSTFSLGAQLKLNYELLDDKLFLVSTLAYQNGGSIFELAGGGFNYSFVHSLFGIEVFLGQ